MKIFVWAIIVIIFFVSLQTIQNSKIKYKKDRQKIAIIMNEIKNSSSGLAGQGFRCAMNGDYKSSIKYLTKSLELEQDPIIYHQRGLSYFYLKDYNNALKDFNTAIKINPQYIDAYGNRSLVKLEFNDYKGALDDINFVLKKAPNYPKAIKQKELILNKINNK